jgi:hypothetical protein
VTQPIFGFEELGRQMREIPTADILLVPRGFPQIPDPLIWVQLWRVGWQLGQQESLGGPSGQKGFDLLGPMDGGAIPNHQQLPGDLAQEQPQEPHDIFRPLGMVLHLHHQSPESE